MPRDPAEQPTELELLILKVLWQKAPLLVREVRQGLARLGRALAHTSVITTLNVMVTKQFVSRGKQGKAFLYAPLVKQEEVSARMLGDVVDRVFDGSATAVVLSLFDLRAIKDDELRALRTLIDEKVKEQTS